MATIDERVAALEARLTAITLALTPPITIGELTNVPAPGSQLAAQWAQDISSRVVQRFPTTAALKAWAAPTGARAIALDTGVMWERIATGWTQRTPWATSAAGVGVSQAAAAGTYTLVTTNIPADPSPNRVAIVSAFVRVYKFGPSDQVVYVTHSGNNVLETYQQSTIDLSLASAGVLLPTYASMSGIFALPANTIVPIALMFLKGGASASRIDAAANFNRLDVVVVPRG